MVKKKVVKRASVDRPYNAGTMTEAEVRSLIISALRGASRWWKPITATKLNSRVARGIYKCEKCGKEGREYSPPPPGKKRRVKNFAVDHKIPIVGPEGFTTYDSWIERAFIETGDGLRLLCQSCHTGVKSKEENEARKKVEKLTKEEEGKTYGRLTVLKGIDVNMVECECDCGIIRKVNIFNLKNGHTRSCGCIMGTHKLSGTRMYKIWTNINSRCNNPNATGYKYYGGKGIEVEWNCFEDFYEDMKEGYSDKLTIDRKNSNGNYSKENCRWATYKEQANNKTDNHILTFEGETFNIKEWADKIGIKQNTLLYRIRRGWKIGEALGVDERIMESKSILKEEYYDDIINLLKTKTQAEVGKLYGVDGSIISRFITKYKAKKAF